LECRERDKKKNEKGVFFQKETMFYSYAETQESNVSLEIAQIKIPIFVERRKNYAG
jgi:hypothetical protein